MSASAPSATIVRVGIGRHAFESKDGVETKRCVKGAIAGMSRQRLLARIIETGRYMVSSPWYDASPLSMSKMRCVKPLDAARHPTYCMF